MKDALETAIKSWDGKNTGPLTDIFATHQNDPAFSADLVALCEIEANQRGATWLLKHHFDQKGLPFSEKLTRKHLSNLSQIRHWEAKLHILQYLERLEIPEEMAETTRIFVVSSLQSGNKMERAWAYYGLATLAIRFPNLKAQHLEILESAQRQETAGSIKVRIRKALHKLNN
jgi:hypothetical protein